MPPAAQSYTIPPAIGGWNDRDALDLMSEQDAIKMQNIFPGIGSVALRSGSRSHSTGMTGAVDSLFEYVKQDGTRQMIAAANGELWNTTSYSGTASSLGSGYSSNYWSAINFNNKLLLCNGVDQPLQYDGSALSNAAYTGISDDALLIHWNSFRSHVYGVEKDSASVWYGALNAVTGALTEFTVEGVLTKGGYLLWTNSWTRDKGSGAADLFLMLSSMGELLIYTGASPDDTDNWALVGHFYLPYPLGRRSFVKLESEVAILTELGLIPLSSVLSDSVSKVTDKIQNAFRKAVTLYKSNTGWDVVRYPRGNMLLVNVPITSNGQSQQYVMNTLTGAWCQFTGWDGYSWSLLNEKLYFGTTGGKVFEADINSNDNGSAIAWDIRQAFNYLGDRNRIKQYTMVKPIIFGETSATYQVGIDTDFSNKTSPNPSITTTGTSGSPWDTAVWDTAPWDNGSVFNDKWTGCAGIGRCVSLRLSGVFTNAPFSLDATQITYKTGGVL
jgi:hypothetical protein